MSSPGLTVNDVMEWLERVLQRPLPTLPFSGVWTRLTALFTSFISGPLPPPEAPLPWTIDVVGTWDNVIPGTQLSIESIQIVVSEETSVSPPAALGAITAPGGLGSVTRRRPRTTTATNRVTPRGTGRQPGARRPS